LLHSFRAFSWSTHLLENNALGDNYISLPEFMTLVDTTSAVVVTVEEDL
jgi:hypothetical protein